MAISQCACTLPMHMLHCQRDHDYMMAPCAELGCAILIFQCIFQESNTAVSQRAPGS